MPKRFSSAAKSNCTHTGEFDSAYSMKHETHQLYMVAFSSMGEQFVEEEGPMDRALVVIICFRYEHMICEAAKTIPMLLNSVVAFLFVGRALSDGALSSTNCHGFEQLQKQQYECYIYGYQLGIHGIDNLTFALIA